MMLQNYTYVDPVVDPLLILAVMLGVVVLAAVAMAVAFARPARTDAPAPTADVQPFVAPHVERSIRLPSMPREDNGDWDDAVVYDAMRSADRRSRAERPTPKRELEPA